MIVSPYKKRGLIINFYLFLLIFQSTVYYLVGILLFKV